MAVNLSDVDGGQLEAIHLHVFHSGERVCRAQLHRHRELSPNGIGSTATRVQLSAKVARELTTARNPRAH
jgi:hypothetical protein